METDPATARRPVAVPAHAGWRLLALVYDCLPMIPLLFIISGLFLWLNGGRTIEGNPAPLLLPPPQAASVRHTVATAMSPRVKRIMEFSLEGVRPGRRIASAAAV